MQQTLRNRKNLWLACSLVVWLYGCGWYSGNLDAIAPSAIGSISDDPTLTSPKLINQILSDPYMALGTCPSGVSEITIQLGSTTQKLICSDGLFSGTFDLSAVTDGAIEVRSKTDGRDTMIALLVKDSTGPTIPTNLNVRAWHNLASQTPPLTWVNSTDELSEVETYLARIIRDSDSSVIVDWTQLSSEGLLATTPLIEGQLYHYELRAQDQAHNYSSVAISPAFRVDLTAPSVSSLAWSEAATFVTSPGFTWAATETLSGIEKFEVSYGTIPGSADLLSWISTNTIGSIAPLPGFVVLSDQAYYVNVRATDLAGNQSTVVTTAWAYPRVLKGTTSFVDLAPFFTGDSSYRTEAVIAATSSHLFSGYYVAGLFSSAGVSFNAHRLVRLNSDGTTDISFSIGTGFDDVVHKVLVQSDGKVLVGGAFQMYNSSSANRLIRLNADGSQDMSFNVGVGFDGEVHSMALDTQAGNQIYVVGAFTTYDNSSAPGILRLNPDGSRDATFNVGAGSNGILWDLNVFTDGRILIGGNFTSFNGESIVNAICLLRTGGRDPVWLITPTAGSSSYTIFRIRPYDVNRIVLAGGGAFGKWGSTTVGTMFRVNIADGTLDPGSSSGVYPVMGLAADSVGKVLLVGGSAIGYLNRLLANLTFDNSFNHWKGGMSFSGFGNSTTLGDVLIQSDNKILMAGAFASIADIFGLNEYPAGRIARLNSDGTMDTSFQTNIKVGANGAIHSLALQPDGKIFVGGRFTHFGGSSLRGVARMDSTGNINPVFPGVATWKAGGDSLVKPIVSIAEQSTGHLIIGGSFNYANGNYAQFLARVQSNGVVDPGFVFSVNSSGLPGVTQVAIQTDDKVLVIGSFNEVQSVLANGLLRLNGTSGAPDMSFVVNGGLGFNAKPEGLALASNGKIYLSGFFSSFNGTPVPRLVRLNSDGTLDSGFAAPSTASSSSKIHILDSGKVLALDSGKLARFNSDGTLDVSFVPYAITHFRSAYVLLDGRLLIGSDKELVRLKLDGTRDDTFFVPIQGAVTTILPIAGSQLFLGGLFSLFNLTQVMNGVIIDEP